MIIPPLPSERKPRAKGCSRWSTMLGETRDGGDDAEDYGLQR